MSMLRGLRESTYRQLFDLENGSPTARRLDSFITWLIIVNLAALAIEHIPSLYATHEASFGLFDRISIYIFTLEYVLRLFAAGGDPRYQGKRFATLRFAVTPFALIDILVIAPYWLHLLGIIDLDLRALRALRLLRLLKLLRDFVPALLEFKKMNAGRTLRRRPRAAYIISST
jgi:voltage-gated potassium channel